MVLYSAASHHLLSLLQLPLSILLICWCWLFLVMSPPPVNGISQAAFHLHLFVLSMLLHTRQGAQPSRARLCRHRCTYGEGGLVQLLAHAPAFPEPAPMLQVVARISASMISWTSGKLFIRWYRAKLSAGPMF